MKVKVLLEAGLEQALLGLSLSYRKPIEEMPQVAEKLFDKDDSESKFLRQICVWLDVSAPWRWWKQMAEYRIGMEWNIESQSSSTMHTIMNRPLTQRDFECAIPEDWLRVLNTLIDMGDFDGVTNYLPGCFLYRRVLMTSYQTLRRIFQQRHLHRLREWMIFINEIEAQVEHPEWLTIGQG
jgi:hypothetical protein